MTRYRLEISSTAEKQLKKINKRDQRRLANAMLSLSEDPFPRGCRKLSGYDDVYRVRVGTYRIIYSLENKKLIIVILKVGHRKDIYNL